MIAIAAGSQGASIRHIQRAAESMLSIFYLIIPATLEVMYNYPHYALFPLPGLKMLSSIKKTQTRGI